MKKSIFCLVFLPFVALKAQDGDKKVTRDLRNNTAIQQAKYNRLGNQNSKSSDTPVKSDYFNLEENIKSLMIKEVIPGNFPKSLGSTSKEDYLAKINQWIKENPEFVKPELRNKDININNQ